MGDARHRAGRILTGFQQAVLLSQAGERERELEPIRARVAEVVRENTILKRAVQIQVRWLCYIYLYCRENKEVFWGEFGSERGDET